MDVSARAISQILMEATRRGDPTAVQAAKRDRRKGLGWRYDGLGDWSTDAIFAQLRKLGVDTDEHRFRAQAQAAGRPSTLYERWYPARVSRGDVWDDFPFLAAEEVWERLTPDLICPEMVARRVDPIIEATPADEPPTPEAVSEEIAAAMVLMDYLQSFPEEERGERYEELSSITTWDYEEWLLTTVLSYAGEYPEEVTRIADIMSGFALNARGFQEDLAENLARAGRREDALWRIQQNLERYPDDVQAHIRAGDVYQALDDFDQALAEFTVAAEMACDAEDWGWATDRVQSLFEDAGRAGEWDEFLRRHPEPAPARPTAAPVRSAAPPKPAAQKASPPAGAPAAEPRGHAPCPCGSGKKYRNCCRPRP